MKRFILTTLFILWFVNDALATQHIYITPVSGDGKTRKTGFDSKYASTACTVSCARVFYGNQHVLLLVADVDDATDAALQKNADVLKIPDNLDATLTAGAVTIVQNALENRNIPGNWVTTKNTYRQVARIVIGAFSVLTRYVAIYGSKDSLFSGSVTLGTQYSQLPFLVQDALRRAADDLSLDTSQVTGSTTLRQLLLGAAQQLAARPVTFGGLTI